ncbi:MAG: hypothetical protein ABJG47_05750 [Ekhidna sp.]
MNNVIKLLAITLVVVSCNSDSADNQVIPESDVTFGFTNGSFETGDFSGWELTEERVIREDRPNLGIYVGSWFIEPKVVFTDLRDDLIWVFDHLDQVDTTICVRDFFGPVEFKPTDGDYVGGYGVMESVKSTIYQEVVIPNNATALKWDLAYHNYAFEFVPDRQSIKISLLEPETNEVLQTAFETDKDTHYDLDITAFSANIQEFAGRKVRVIINIDIEFDCMVVLFDNFKFE